MNLRRLEYFLTLAQTGHVRKASEILNVSAAALSKAMKVLEEEVDTKLWVRNGRQIILTDAGKRLMRAAPELVDRLKDLQQTLSSDQGAVRPVSIATFEVFSTYFLEFLRPLKWDDVPLRFHEVLPGELERAVANGDVDFGITYLPIPHPDLDFLKITSVEMGVYVGRGAFPGQTQPHLPFVVPIQPLGGVPTRVRGLDGWPDDAYRRKVLYEVTLMESALELCRQGRAAGYFPTFIVREHNKRVRDELRLERRRFANKPSIASCFVDVFLVKRKSDQESTVAKQLAKAIRLVCSPD